MKKNQKSILSGKGFYVALALSVGMVGVACYFAYTQTSDSLTGELGSSLSTVTERNEKAVAEIRTDIPKVTFAPYVTTKAVTTTVLAETEPPTDFQEPTQQESVTQEKSEETAKPEKKKFVMPLEGEILNEFSGGELVKSKTTGAWQTHNGVDISAALGDVVKASGSGVVSAVDNDPLWGIMVSIDHGNGMLTRYSNLNEGVTVQVGQEVACGEEIGAVGETADIETAEASHLHFEMTKNGSFVNPLDIVK